MRDHERDRRRREAGLEPERRPVTETPQAAALLSLQRSAGNRALVQRLVWNSTTGNLMTPLDYAAEEIAWDGQHVLTGKAAEGHEKESLSDLMTSSQTFKRHMVAALGLEFLGQVKPLRDDQFGTAAESVVSSRMQNSDVAGDSAVHAKMVHDVQTAGTSHNHVLTIEDRKKFRDLGEIAAARRLVLRPGDFLPGVADLPEAGVDLLKTKIPNIEEDKKYWEYACVLIALFKDNGLAKASEVTGKTLPNDVYKAVQALHNHYATQKVAYDDGSARTALMTAWGYSMLFAGDEEWDQLPGKVTLAPGNYIFDIVGHTVKVRVLRQIDPATKITQLGDYFEPDSDGKNYTKGAEVKKKIRSIWKKP